MKKIYSKYDDPLGIPWRAAISWAGFLIMYLAVAVLWGVICEVFFERPVDF